MNAAATALLWCAATIAMYACARAVYRRKPCWWTSPLLVTWTACGLLIIGSHASYEEYLSGTHWMVSMLGPATVAFAVPVYRNRRLIRRYWLMLGVGVITGSILAVASSWVLASVLDLPAALRMSLLPRSITTPLAMAVSHELGGMPELTASCTAITGLFGAAIGDILLACIPVRTSLAKGALFGMGAHGAGVAKAREIGDEEGAVACLIMVFSGLFTVVGASLAVHWL